MKLGSVALAAGSLLLAAGTGAASPAHHVTATLVAQGNSGVHGTVQLTQEPHGGTLVTIVAKGLKPDGAYLSLYYGNDQCEVEAYGEDDVIGTYTGNAAGVAAVSNKQHDDLDEIGSVSVRDASDFSLLACAKVHTAS